MNKRTTIDLNPKLHQAVKMKAVQMHTSVSGLVNEAIRLFLNDSPDLNAIRARVSEPLRSYKAVFKDLKKDGLL